MGYQRVIPRDLFNESKLLKCLGFIALHIHNRQYDLPLVMNVKNPKGGFKIEQDQGSGDLYCSNVEFYLDLPTPRYIKIATSYNSKENFPLVYEDTSNVFNEDGKFSDDFLSYLRDLCK